VLGAQVLAHLLERLGGVQQRLEHGPLEMAQAARALAQRRPERALGALPGPLEAYRPPQRGLGEPEHLAGALEEHLQPDRAPDRGREPHHRLERALARIAASPRLEPVALD